MEMDVEEMNMGMEMDVVILSNDWYFREYQMIMVKDYKCGRGAGTGCGTVCRPLDNKKTKITGHGCGSSLGAGDGTGRG
jgi:hypothetical protein